MLVWTYVLLLTSFVTLVTCSSEEKGSDASGDAIEPERVNKNKGSSTEVEAEAEEPKMESGADHDDDDDGADDNNDRPQGFTRGFSDLRRMKKKVAEDRQAVETDRSGDNMSKSAANSEGSGPGSAEDKKINGDKYSQESGNAYETGVKSTVIMDGSAEPGGKALGRVDNFSDSLEET